MITREANRRPNVAVMCIRAPLVAALPKVIAPDESGIVLTRGSLAMSSGEYTHLNLRLGMQPLFLNFLRRAAASGQPVTFQNSATSIFAGSIFNAAPIEE